MLIDHISDTPTTVLLCTHHVSEFDQFADHIGVLRNGELRAQLPLLELRRGLRRYRADIPPDWSGTGLFGAAALRKTTTQRDLDWTVWGDESAITAELAAAGAVVRDAVPLSLSDATLALLSPKEVTVRPAAGVADDAHLLHSTEVSK